MREFLSDSIQQQSPTVRDTKVFIVLYLQMHAIVMIRRETFRMYNYTGAIIHQKVEAYTDVNLRNAHTLHRLPVRKKVDFKIATVRCPAAPAWLPDR